MAIQSFLHVKLDILNIEESLDFYCGYLNLRQICRYEIPNGAIIQLSTTGKPPGIELWYDESYQELPETRIHIAFDVDDVRSFTEELRSKGIEIATEPFEIGDEVISFIRDPNGYLIELNQNKPVESATSVN